MKRAVVIEFKRTLEVVDVNEVVTPEHKEECVCMTCLGSGVDKAIVCGSWVGYTHNGCISASLADARNMLRI